MSRVRAVLLVTAAILVMAAGLGSASASGAVAKGFWGAAQYEGKSEFPHFDKLGVDIYQLALRWDSVAPTRPQDPANPSDPAYKWPAEVAYALAEAKKYKIRVLIMLIGSPPWANGGNTWQWAPSKPSDFANFARAAARRYPAVKLWQVWGEPNRAPNWQPMTAMDRDQTKPLTAEQARAPRHYARLLDAAYAALKKLSKRNLVVGGSSFTGGEIRPVAWVKNMRLSNGRAPRMDLYGHNPFAQREPKLSNPSLANGAADFSDLDWFNRTVDRYLAKQRPGRHLRLFLGEFTVPTSPRDREFGYWVTPETQARWIKSGFKVASQVGAYAFGWIPLRDDPPDPNGAPTRHTGLLNFDGAKKPGYDAFRRAP